MRGWVNISLSVPARPSVEPRPRKSEFALGRAAANANRAAKNERSQGCVHTDCELGLQQANELAGFGGKLGSKSKRLGLDRNAFHPRKGITVERRRRKAMGLHLLDGPPHPTLS